MDQMPHEKIVAIHQPNFYPWLGYFDKIARADVFIMLDNVQFPKKGGTWCNRVKLMVGGKPDWVTMPVDRSYHGVRPIQDIKINNFYPWREKLLKTIRMNYKQAEYFEEVFPFLSEMIAYATDSLVEYNLNVIILLIEKLHLGPRQIILGSALKARGQATSLLIGMIQEVGGTVYICGGGAQGYQEDEKFPLAGIQLVYQNFQHPAYPQKNVQEFVAGLSIIDVLMHCGLKGCRAFLRPL